MAGYKVVVTEERDGSVDAEEYTGYRTIAEAREAADLLKERFRKMADGVFRMIEILPDAVMETEIIRELNTDLGYDIEEATGLIRNTDGFLRTWDSGGPGGLQKHFDGKHGLTDGMFATHWSLLPELHQYAEMVDVWETTDVPKEAARFSATMADAADRLEQSADLLREIDPNFADENRCVAARIDAMLVRLEAAARMDPDLDVDLDEEPDVSDPPVL